MKQLKNVLLGLVLFAAGAIGFWLSPWSPLNLLFGPQYSAPSRSTGDSRSMFRKETVPRMYPILVQSLQTRGTETVSWISQSGEPQEAVLTLTAQGLLIETAIFTGSSPSAATTSTIKINVQMLDANLNGRMDSISYIDPSGGTHRIQEPFDEMSLLLWDTALAMTFRVGKCCR